MVSHTALQTDDSVQTGILFLEQLTAGYPGEDFSVEFWDGSRWGKPHDTKFILLLRHPGALRRMFSSPSELTLGEAFIYGDFDIAGDMDASFDFAEWLMRREFSIGQKLHMLTLLRQMPRGAYPNHIRQIKLDGKPHSQHRDRAAISYHYDVSNAFMSLFLDRQMIYSCGYFRSADDDLDTAQEQKLDYICRKLRLQPGERVLDVGCGWGGLLMHAAKYYGAQALGITLSVAQAELARQRIRHAGLTDRCKVELCDYRDVDSSQPYDKLVSVGMFEHVGEALLPEYFQCAWKLLRPGGVFLNHGIAASAVYKRSGPSFIGKYVFPDGELEPLHVTVRAAELSGFEVRDVENLREHYLKTLQLWVSRLESNAAEACRLTDDVTYRIWRIYMSGSAHAFRTGRTSIYQVLLSKPENGASNFPPTREDWYREPEVSQATTNGW